MLGGSRDGETAAVSDTFRVRNASDTPRVTYVLDPEQQLARIETIEGAGDEVVGFYHSHPAGPLRPSATDTARAAWSGVSYVIVSLDAGEPAVGSWRWNGDDERFERESVRVESNEGDRS